MKVIKRLSLGAFVAVLALLIALPTISFAGGEPIVKTNRLEGALGQIKVDSIVMVIDSNLINTTYTSTNKVALSIDEAALFVIQGSFNASVSVHIDATLNNNYVAQFDTVLRINYQESGNYVREHAFFIKNAYRIQVKITGISTDAGWNVWNLLKLTAEISSIVQYDFSCALNAIDDISSESLAANTDKDELLVSWPNKMGADEYDLEWAYVDSSALVSGQYGNPSNPSSDLIFDHNSSRVSIKETSYKIPLIYDSRGHLFFRVRSVQVMPLGQRLAANWSTNSSALGRFDYDGHERKLNWQATTTYAEEGKRKTIVQYFDGSLRNRQTVTKDNTGDSSTIVAETFYDLQGRPAVQVLPSPTLENVIKYHQNFNTGIGGTEYTTDMYDLMPGDAPYCGLAADSMSSSSGASRYYSKENPERNTGMHRFIPDARKYPFTETQYTQDNTGRITKQGGVGPVHKVGSGHETTYYYGTPSQEELDALFGTEVGHYSHYQKTAVKDANGQFSVSYLDMHGRTVATALAGIATEAALDTLGSYTQETITETIADSSSAVIKDLIIESKKGLIVPRTALHTFTYELSPQSLQLEGCTQAICYDCLYDLRITISGSCNNEAFGGQPFDTVVTNFNLTAIDGDCNAPGFSFSFTKLLTEGNYEITKQLSVSKYGIDFYRDSIFAPANTCKNFDDFVNEQRTLLANLPCAANCDSCKASIGSWNSFRNAYLQNAGIITDTASYTGQAYRAYEEAIAACAALCDETTEYDDIRNAMIADVSSPSGQYANAENTTDPYSIFNGGTPGYKLVTNYLDEEGNIDFVYDRALDKFVKPNELSPEQFAANFKTSWGEQLLVYHPEYCKLLLYETYVKPSAAWAKRFENVDTYAEAVAKGYLNPSDNNTSPFNDYTTWPGSHPDPDPLASVLNFNNYVENGMINFRSSGISVWNMAMGMVTCPQGALITCYTQMTPFANTYCEADKDMAWRNFRGMYLGLRKDFIDILVAGSACNGSSLPEALMVSGHQPHFASATNILEQNGIDQPASMGDVKSLEQSQRARMNANYDTTCRAYIPQWRKELEGCYDPVTLDQIIDKMLQVCKNGADESHPFGASSTAPTSSYQYKSFQDVLDDYSPGNTTCTADRITMPQPYNKQIIYSAKPVWSKPDSCECARVNTLYEEYQSQANNYVGFSDFMKKKFNTEFSDSSFNVLRDLCAGSNSSCTYLKAPILLPPVMQCYSGDICVDCEKMKEAYSSFKLKYPGITPTDNPGDSNQIRNNLLFQNFFNNSFGFNKSASDYISFLISCNEHPLDPYSPYNLIKWMQDFKKYGGVPHLDAGGSDTTHWKINYSNSSNFVVPVEFRDVFQNGYAKLPDTVQHNINFSQINWDYYDDVCVDSSGFTFETRIKIPDSTLRGQQWYNSPLWIWLGSPYGPGPGSTIFSLNFNNKLGFCTHGNDGDPLKQCADYNSIVPYSAHFNDFRIVKAQLRNRVCKIFLDDTLLLERSLDTPITKLSVWSIMTFSGKAEIDYIRLYDTAGNYIFKEEFSNPDSLSIARSNCLDDCRYEFKDYFNQLAKENYVDKLVSDFQRNSPSTPFGQYNCDTTDWAITPTEVFSGDLPTWAESIQGGILTFPSRITTNPVDLQYRYLRPLVIPSDGLSIETRLKLPILDSTCNFPNFQFQLRPAGGWLTALFFQKSLPCNKTYGAIDIADSLRPNHSVTEYPQMAIEMQDWVKIKISILPGKYQVFVADTLLLEEYYTGTLTELSYFNLFFATGPRWSKTRPYVDYIKIYNGSQQLVFNQEFNSVNDIVCPDLSIRCSPDDYKAVYESYFSQLQDFNYTIDQIDSIYTYNTGRPLDICPINDSSCLLLTTLISNYKYRDNPKSVNWTFETKKAIIQRPDCVNNGIFHLPDQYSISPYSQSPLYDPNDVAASVGTRATFRLKDTTQNFCLPNGYSIETRAKLPRNPMNKPGYDVGISVFQNNGGLIYGDFETNNSSQLVFSDFVESGAYVQLTNQLIPGTSTGFDDWHIIRFTIKPSKYQIYLDGILVYSADRNPAIPIRPFYGGYVGLAGYDGYVDYFLIKDESEKLVYREDFNDPYIPAKPDLSRICPSGNACTVDFANYYNSINSTSYTYNQIDSISLSSCGKHLNVCGDDVPASPCDDQAQIVDDYKNGINKGANSCNGEVWYQKSTIHADGSPTSGRLDSGYIRINRLDTLLNSGILYTKDIPNEPDTIKTLATDLQVCNLSNAFVYETRMKVPSYSFNYNGLRLYNLKLTTDKTNLSVTIANQPGWGSYNLANTSPSSLVGNGSIAYLANLDIWNTVKVVAKNNNFKVYVNDSLILETPATSVLFEKLISMHSSWNYGNDGALDYVRIFNGSGQLIYNEEFENCSEMSMPLPAHSCNYSGLTCQQAFVEYYNFKRGTNLSFQTIDSLSYYNCGYHIDVCTSATDSINGPTLCGNFEPVAPPVDVNAITNCSDSSFFIYSTATELYKVYTDSLSAAFDARYRAKCLDAYKMEKFTVSHEVSEYHYTLYYYDQAGNLVKTVPPKGVIVNRSIGWLSDIKSKRALREAQTPAHTLPTNYRYNTLNQVVAQHTPDAGISEFWYDRLGRLAMSQNARQKAVSETAQDRLYSYTTYDYLGRITEVGQIKDNIGVAVDDNLTKNQSSLDSWLNNRLSYKGQITNTVYDEAYPLMEEVNNALILQQRNLRNRVSYTTYTDTASGAFSQATFYSYDIHGNVDTLLQDYGVSWAFANVMNANGNRFKKVVYDYDLISGKVNKVSYQPGWADQLYHKYSYDAENRLTRVETSTDNKTWEQDATYDYYRHGPLARMVLGQQQVQGLDYAYTLQGWLKGVNSTILTNYDMGGDGLASTSNQLVARDAIGFNLNYYDTSDYSAISDANPFPGIYAYQLADYYRPLFNGNISSMAVNNRALNGAGNVGGPLMLYNYRYDQLNRLTRMDAANKPSVIYNNWGGLTLMQQFKEYMTYDGNGNILTLRRHAHKGAFLMDALTYSYYDNSNKLSRVYDPIPPNRYGSDAGDVPDIDLQAENNYQYDEIGNLIKDSAEGITNIKWSVYGKILEISRTPGGSNPVNKIVYTYDAQGNRISKVLHKSNGTISYTWYVRDAQGNTLATYQSSGSSISNLYELPLKLSERHLYGSSRLGIYSATVDVDNGPRNMSYENAIKYTRGLKQYELTNHLGNVLTTITDKKKGVDTNSDGFIDHYDADITTAQDYYPFGMLMPSRIGYQTENGWTNEPGGGGSGGDVVPGNIAIDSRVNNAPPEYTATNSIELNPGFQSGSGDTFLAYISKVEQGSGGSSGNNSSLSNGYYRYGFNGKENDNEVKGVGNQQDYGMRIYDPRLGRFLSVDPLQKKYPDLSSYQFTNNSPIAFIDPDGLERYYYALTYDQKNGGKPVLTHQSTLERYPTLLEAFLIGFNKDIKLTGDVPKKEIIVGLPSGDSKSFGSFKELWEWNKTLNPQSQTQINEAKAEFEKAKEQVDAATQILVNEAYFRYDMADGNFDLDALPNISQLSSSTKSSPKNKVNEQSTRANGGNSEAANANDAARPTITYEGKQYEIKADVPYKRPDNATTVAQRRAVNQTNAQCATCGTSKGPFVADHKTPLAIEHISTGTINKPRMRSVEATQSQCKGCSLKQSAAVRKASQEANKYINQSQNK